MIYIIFIITWAKKLSHRTQIINKYFGDVLLDTLVDERKFVFSDFDTFLLPSLYTSNNT